MVGINGGGWGPNGDDDISASFKYVRVDQGGGTSDEQEFIKNGTKMIVDYSGPYNGVSANYSGYVGGVQTLVANGGAQTWANNAVSWYKANCDGTNVNCPAIEVLNEPDGWWFWGYPNDPNTSDSANADAYAVLVHTAYTTFHSAFGSNSPKILATADSSWGQEWWNYDSSSLGPSSSYVDGVVSHPYGGNDSNYAASAAGNQSQVAAEHTLTGKPVYVTEVGWPTDDSGPSPTQNNATGDSDQWPLADSSSNSNHGLDQCDNVYNFVKWAKGTGYVNAVTIYGFRNSNDTGNAQYGLEFWTSPYNKKPAWYSLEAAAQNQANPCPSASNGYKLQ